jgi:polar amino acid transport system substrate-binding protein
MTAHPSLAREFAPTGRLRAALNMGNPVLAHSRTSRERPAGVSIDLARAFAAQLGVEVSFQEYESAAHSGGALADGFADVAFLAIDPKRAERIHFTPPYVEIEGCYLVRGDSPLRDNTEVDRPGIQVVVGDGSAYELFLSRTITQARLVKVPTSEEVVRAMLARPDLQVAAGVRQQLAADAARLGGVRLLPGRFMVIRQAMAMRRGGSAQAIAMLDAFIEEQKRSGCVADALARHGIEGAAVAG